MASVANINSNQIKTNPAVGSKSPVGSAGSNLNKAGENGLGQSFKDILGAQIHPPQVTTDAKNSLSSLKFSNHAIERMRSRGISFDQEVMSRIENAVSKAAQKGAKETLLLTDNSALIVSVKNNTVVTVMDKAGLKDNVFTNIDSTVVI